MHTQLYAGYVLTSVLQAIHRENETEYWNNLLRKLSIFDVESESLDRKINDPIITVADNLLSRGLPTIPPLFIEEYIASSFDIAEKHVSVKTGEISFNLTDNCNWDIIKKAFHIIDPRLNKHDHLLFEINSWERHPGSDYEEDFLYELLPDIAGEYAIQLIEPQRSIKSILNYTTTKQRRVDSFLGLYTTDFYGQHVDFSVEFPPTHDDEIGLIIEIDGNQHNSEGQQKLDQTRDLAVEKVGWHKTVRIKTNEFQNIDKSKITDIEAFFEQKYGVYIKDNYLNPLWLEKKGIDALQIALSPIGIARIQKSLTTLIQSGNLDLKSDKWNIAVIERDVPCADLALMDFKELLFNLFRLEGKDRKLPEIELRVYNTDEFRECRLNETFITEQYSGEVKNFNANVIIDCAVLQRPGFSKPSGEFLSKVNSSNIVIIRSCHSEIAERKVLSANPIKYKVENKKTPDYLKYFLT